MLDMATRCEMPPSWKVACHDFCNEGARTFSKEDQKLENQVIGTFREEVPFVNSLLLLVPNSISHRSPPTLTLSGAPKENSDTVNFHSPHLIRSLRPSADPGRSWPHKFSPSCVLRCRRKKFLIYVSHMKFSKVKLNPLRDLPPLGSILAPPQSQHPLAPPLPLQSMILYLTPLSSRNCGRGTGNQSAYRGGERREGCGRSRRRVIEISLK